MISIAREVSSSLLRTGFVASRCSTYTCHTKASSARPQTIIQGWPEKSTVYHGQPTASTHPFLIQDGEVLPGLASEEFRDRRFRLMDCIQKFISKSETQVNNHVVVIPSASKVYMTEKIPYVFRQNTDFLYLTGCLEPESTLVLSSVPGKDLPTHISTLFVRKKDPHSELWDGPRTGVESAVKLFGIDQALPASELDQFLESFMKSHRSFALWYDYMNPVQSEVHKIIRDFLSTTWHKVLESPRHLIHQLRLIKSPAEIQLMKKTCEIASEAITSTIKSSRPHVTEHQLFAKVDYECRMRGAEYLAYPPVVAGGNRANIIHYINNNQQVAPGEMVLMDAGSELHGYCSDITRTWPVTGRFTQAQRDLYEAVLSVQTDVIQLCAARPTLDSLFHSMCQMLGKKLKELGILPADSTEDELARAAYGFCPHHVSHYLGMDVHDTALIPRSIHLQPGMVITVEPGIYVSMNNKIAPPQYHGLGIRLEDDVLITESGPVVLTAKCPKQIEEIESLASSYSVSN